jgi:DNA-binding transcriptional LysR family regulator
MKLRSIDLNLLIALDALLRERHVTRAAERLDASQSSMSVALAKLRDLFGDELLMRSPNGLTPTPRAEELWPRVKAAIDAMEQVFEPSPAFDPSTATENFRLIVIDYIDIILMPHVMRRLRQEAPLVTVQLMQPNPHHFGEKMAEGELDLALSYFPQAPEFLKTRRLFSDRFVALCGAGNPALHKRLNAAEFCALPHVTIEPEAAQIYNVLIDETLEPLRLRRNVRMIKPSFLALPFLLEKTDLIACVPARLAQRMESMADVRPFEIPFVMPTFEVRSLWHPRSTKAPAQEWLRTLVRECAIDLDPGQSE